MADMHEINCEDARVTPRATGSVNLKSCTFNWREMV